MTKPWRSLKAVDEEPIDPPLPLTMSLQRFPRRKKSLRRLWNPSLQMCYKDTVVACAPMDKRGLEKRTPWKDRTWITPNIMEWFLEQQKPFLKSSMMKNCSMKSTKWHARFSKFTMKNCPIYLLEDPIIVTIPWGHLVREPRLWNATTTALLVLSQSWMGPMDHLVEDCLSKKSVTPQNFSISCAWLSNNEK